MKTSSPKLSVTASITLILLTVVCGTVGAASAAEPQACDCPQYGAWYDEQTNLSWQDPQKDAYSEDNGGMTSFDAIRYCEELVIEGHDDWRLPTIKKVPGLFIG